MSKLRKLGKSGGSSAVVPSAVHRIGPPDASKMISPLPVANPPLPGTPGSRPLFLIVAVTVAAHQGVRWKQLGQTARKRRN
jgi:hypothetical protein